MKIENLKIGQYPVYHSSLYWAREPMKVVGIRADSVELEGDYSGGTHNVCQRDWLPLQGLTMIKGEGGNYPLATKMVNNLSA